MLFSFMSVSQKQDYEKAINYHEKGFYQKSDSLFTLVINDEQSRNKIDYIKYYNRALNRMKLDEFQNAKNDLDTVIMINDTFFEAYERRGLCEYYLGNYESCFKDAEQSLLLNKTNAEAYTMICVVNFYLGQYDAVIKVCNEANRYINDIRIYSYRVMANLRLGNYNDALCDINKMDQFSDYKNDINYLESSLWYEYFTKGEMKKVCSYYQTILNLSNNYWGFIYNDLDIDKVISSCK